jgi:ABC-type protease/lipase transport system fused ATPase/permease subunit
VELAVAGWRAFVDARGAYSRLDELMREQQRDESNRTRLPEPKGALMVENVSFGVRNPDRVILRGVNFSLEPGESLGLIGPSAAGKSTLSRLVAGVWRASAGAVRLDGAELSQWDRGQLADYLGYLPQDVELLAGTVAENIARLGEVDPEKVVQAAKLIDMHEIILGFPKGYDTMLGETGFAPSGGQRQRLAIARAIYGMPKYVVMDEPNSNLDELGESALIQCVMALKQNGGSVVITTHRPRLINTVDMMLVLKAGRQVAYGSSKDMLEAIKRLQVVPGEGGGAPTPSAPAVAAVAQQAGA